MATPNALPRDRKKFTADVAAPMSFRAATFCTASVMTGERNRQLRQAVEDLPEHYRLVMMFFYFEEMSVEQISKTLGASVSAVKVRLHRGRERLANRLDVIQAR